MAVSIRKTILREVKRRKLSGYRVAKMVEGHKPSISMRMVQGYLRCEYDMTGDRLSVLLDVLDLELRPKRAKAR